MIMVCKSCGQTVPADAPHGMCPACLLQAVLKPELLSENGNRFLSPTTPGPRAFQPASIDTLRPLFPGLELISLIGYGGMGAVYKARQTKLDRLVALKIIRSDAAADPAFAERFSREARTLARLSHPGIVGIHDFGETGSSSGDHSAPPMFYFVMEFVDGTNLRQLMNGHQLAPEQAVAIVPQICDALQYAHDEGIVHRDIKPENILIDHRGRVKIADFGLAKLVAGPSEEFTLTGTHQVMGTPRYMAPEQMEGSRTADHRADIYSLGVVFYEMLTGQVPAGHFDPPSHMANVDHRLDSIVLKAMARDPERRFQRASEVRINVERLAADLVAATGPNRVQEAQAETVIRPVPHTMSEFLSVEAASVARWVAGTREKKDGLPLVIRWLMPLLCLVAIATLFQPWLQVYVTDRDAVIGAPPQRLTTDPLDKSPAVLRQFAPIEFNYGMIAASCLVFLLVMQSAAAGADALSRRMVFTQIAMGILVFFLLVSFRQETGTASVSVYNDPETGALPRNFQGNVSDGVGASELRYLEHSTFLTPVAWAGVASMLALVVLNSLSLRYAITTAPGLHRPSSRSPGFWPFRRSQNAAAGQSLTPAQLASRLLTIIGVVMLSLTVIGFFFSVFITTSLVNSQEELDRARWSGMILLGLLILTVFLGSLSIVAGRLVIHRKGIALSRFVCVMVILGGTFTMPVTMPLAFWCLIVLGRVVPDDSAPRQSGSSRRWMIIATAALILIVSVVIVFKLMSPSQQNAVPELLVETLNGDAAAVKRLLEAGADPNEYPAHLGPPLFSAVCFGDPFIIESLVQHGARVDDATAEGITPLMVACLKGDVQTVRFLIDHGANVNSRDAVSQAYTIYPRTGSINWPGRQMTPLMLAASQGHRAVVEMLLAAGADATLTDASGQDAASLALSGNYTDVHDLIPGSPRASEERPPSDAPTRN